MLTRPVPRLLRTSLWPLVLAGLAPSTGARPAPASEPGNVLLLVADDIGIEHVNRYKVGPQRQQPPTPVLDALADSGLLFRNVWACPTCSPARVMMMTGRYPWRTGIGDNVANTSGMPLTETTVFEAVRGAGVHTTFLGKWHMGRRRPFLDPVLQGSDLFLGTRGNPTDYFTYAQSLVIPWAEISYPPQGYSTTELTDHALAAVQALPEPWFLVVSYHAAHRPFHVPPAHLHTYDNPTTDVDKFGAMVQALDTELGRLLGGVDLATTTVMFCGDNGSPSTVSAYGESAKGSLYEPGLRVPLLVAGRAVKVAPGETHALVSLADLFATVADLYQVPSAAEDSVSFRTILAGVDGPRRRSMMSERFVPNGPGPYLNHVRAARDTRYKLRLDLRTGAEEFYDLEAGEPGTDGPLLDLLNLTPAQRRSYERLGEVIRNGAD